MQEILERRSYTRKTFQREDGAFVSRCHAGHIHYKHDVTGELTDTDFAWIDAGAFWVISGASYRLRVAKDFGAANLLQFQNRFEGATHTITYDPRRLIRITNRNFNAATTLTATDGQPATQRSVQGVITGQTIRFTNAFGPGIHFEVIAKRSGFTKEIVIDSLAALGALGANQHVALIMLYGGAGLTLRDGADQAWDGATLFERSERLRLLDAQNRPTFIAPAYVVDASNRQTSVPVAFAQRPEGVVKVKILPRNIIDNAVYPLRADTTTQFFAGAGDGHVRNTNAVWATCHDALTGDLNNDTAVTVRVISSFLSPNFSIQRVFFPIDTSGLPDTDVISSADLKLQYVSSFLNTDNDGDDFLVVVGPTSQASTSQLDDADFDQCGAVTNPQELSARIDFGSLSQSTTVYESFAFDATGLANINKTGFTLLGLREGHDVINSAIDNSATKANRADFASSEDTSGTKDPYLEVVHAAAGGARITRPFPLGMEIGMNWQGNL